MNLLILDIDETLIHARAQPLDRGHDFKVGHYFVYCRPHLDHFLETVGNSFELAVWTTAGSIYAETVVAELDLADLAFLWTRDRCAHAMDPETREPIFIKDLKKVKRRGYDLDRVLMVDDSPEKLARNYGNLIRVKAFEGDPADDDLRRLARYLPTLVECANVRSIEKRYWRTNEQHRNA